MNHQEYIKTEFLVLIPVLYFVGECLKKSKYPNKWIPVTLGIIAIALSVIWLFATTELSEIKEIALAIFTAITQGILVAGSSVYVNQIYVQSKKKE